MVKMAFYLVRMCIVCIANNINRNVYVYLNTRTFQTTGYARVMLFMFIRREQGGTGTGCLFQFTYCDNCSPSKIRATDIRNLRKMLRVTGSRCNRLVQGDGNP